jgi:hypothetical protein
MAERTLALRYRVPDAARLAWARPLVAQLAGRLPESLPEIYAGEALHLHERQRTELKLQAIRVGDLGLAAIPNEVFALTGLKLKARSPLRPTLNVGLANGAEGYIPPPEQHVLGGYTTWPARTAGLEVGAEPQVVEALLRLLEEVAGRRRRTMVEEQGPYARMVLAARPVAYWRLNEMVPPTATDATRLRHHATYEEGVALFLPGVGSGEGRLPTPQLRGSAFSGTQINRAPHFAGGRLWTPLRLGRRYSVEFWVWNGLPAEARPVTGYLFSRGGGGAPAARGEHLAVGGTRRPEETGKLVFASGEEGEPVLVGRNSLGLRTWHHIVLVRDGREVVVYLDGRADLSGSMATPRPGGRPALFWGGRCDGEAGLEGRLDEIAVYGRALRAKEVAAHYDRAGGGVKRP